MANTTGFKARVEYEVTDGTQKTYTFPFSYLRKKFVMVSILHSDASETALEYGVDYTVNDLSVSLTTPAQVGEHIIIYRQTSTDKIVTWNDGSILLARDMNTEDAQMLHLQEEQQDYIMAHAISTKVTSDKEVLWDALNHRVINVSDPKDPQDAVTKHYMETVQGGFVAANTILVQEATKQASAAKSSQEAAKTSETAAANSAKKAAESAGVFQDFKGATASSDGLGGKVLKPLAGQQNKVLKADGTWGDGVTPVTLWEGMHTYPMNYVPSDVSNLGWNKLGFCSIYYDTVVLDNQPSQYGQLINIPATKDDIESTQLWLTQHEGSIFFRGGNTEHSVNNIPFKAVATTDDVNAREKVTGQGSNWIRYESGLQLCWNSNVAAETHWSFPVAFAHIPAVTLTCRDTNWTWLDDLSTTGVTNQGSGGACVIAVGRWK